MVAQFQEGGVNTKVNDVNVLNRDTTFLHSFHFLYDLLLFKDFEEFKMKIPS